MRGNYSRCNSLGKLGAGHRIRCVRAGFYCTERNTFIKNVKFRICRWNLWEGKKGHEHEILLHFREREMEENARSDYLL